MKAKARCIRAGGGLVDGDRDGERGGEVCSEDEGE